MRLKNKLKAPLLVTLALLIGLAVNSVLPKIERRLEIKKANEVNREILENIEKVQSAQSTQSAQPAQQNQPDQPTDQKLLKVQFICQAPLRTEENWKFHEESCEEAALLQAYNFEAKETTTNELANEKILNMIDWQEDFFGEHKDLYDDDMKKFAENYLMLNEGHFITIKNATLADIKTQIDQDHPVIVPVTSQFLENPYYPYPGYHMLTVTGYTKDHIITNDNGTCRGESYAYENEKFEKAMKDAGDSIFIITLDQ